MFIHRCVTVYALLGSVLRTLTVKPPEFTTLHIGLTWHTVSICTRCNKHQRSCKCSPLSSAPLFPPSPFCSPLGTLSPLVATQGLTNYMGTETKVGWLLFLFGVLFLSYVAHVEHKTFMQVVAESCQGRDCN